MKKGDLVFWLNEGVWMRLVQYDVLAREWTLEDSDSRVLVPSARFLTVDQMEEALKSKPPEPAKPIRVTGYAIIDQKGDRMKFFNSKVDAVRYRDGVYSKEDWTLVRVDHEFKCLTGEE